jgi:enoyl-CoA hydratase
MRKAMPRAKTKGGKPANIANDVLYETVRGGEIAVITFNRPERLNALTNAHYRRTCDLIWQAEKDEAVRAIVFRGAGRAFSSGHDVDEAYDFYLRPGDDPKRRPSMRRRLLVQDGTLWGKRGITEVIFYCLKPTICVLHGRCFGSGLDILMSCDIALAADDTLFGHPGFTYHGFGGDLASYIFQFGLKRAKEFTLTSRPFDAAKAQRWGLVNHVVPRAKLEAELDSLLDDLMRMPIDALVMQKAHYRVVLDGLGFATNFSAALQALAFASNIRYEKGDNVMVRDKAKFGSASAAIKARKKHYGHL